MTPEQEKNPNYWEDNWERAPSFDPRGPCLLIGAVGLAIAIIVACLYEIGVLVF